MSNQRAGRFHGAGASDSEGGSIPLKALILFVTQAQQALEHIGEDESALRFEIFGDYLREDVANGARFEFTTKTLGL